MLNSLPYMWIQMILGNLSMFVSVDHGHRSSKGVAFVSVNMKPAAGMHLSGGQVPHCNRDRRPPDVTTSCLTPDPWFENGIDPWSSAKRENPGAGTKAIEKRVRYSDHADALRADTVVGDNVVLAAKTLDAGTHDALSEFLVIQEKYIIWRQI